VHREGRVVVSICIILDKWHYFLQIYFFFITILFMLLLLILGDSGDYCGCLHFSTSEERRHTMQICVSIGVFGQRVPAMSLLLIVLNSLATSGCYKAAGPVRWYCCKASFSLFSFLTTCHPLSVSLSLDLPFLLSSLNKRNHMNKNLCLATKGLKTWRCR
jgi:hypothetical protein